MKLRKIIIKLMTLLAVITLTVTLSACGKKESLGRIKSRKTLVVGMLNSNPPAEFHKEVHGKDRMQGSDVFLAHQVAKKLHVHLKLKTMDANGCLPSLEAGKVDMLITELTSTPQRKKSVSFSKPYFKGDQNFVVTRKQDVNKFNHNPNLLNRSTVAVMNSSIQQTAVAKHDPKAHIKGLTEFTDLALAVKNDKADAFVASKDTDKLLVHRNKDLAMTHIDFHTGGKGAAIVLQKHVSKKLLKKVNQIVVANRAKFAKVDSYEISQVPKLK